MKKMDNSYVLISLFVVAVSMVFTSIASFQIMQKLENGNYNVSDLEEHSVVLLSGPSVRPTVRDSSGKRIPYGQRLPIS